jgi:hypothetical protein
MFDYGKHKRTEMVTAGLGQPLELAIRADIEVPERKLAVTWSLRQGTPATHVVDIMFKLPEDFPAGGNSNVPGILMKQAEQTATFRWRETCLSL